MDPTSKYAALARKIDLFHGLSAEEVAKIVRRGTTIRVDKGEAIFFKGTTGSQMYVLLGGTVGIFDGERLIATLRSGDMFGEMALISNEPRSASVIAMEASHLFVLTETTFQRLINKRAAIRILLNIVSTLSSRLRTATAKLKEFTSP